MWVFQEKKIKKINDDNKYKATTNEMINIS